MSRETMNYFELLKLDDTRFDLGTPEGLLAGAAAYFEWCEDNSLQEEQLTFYKGVPCRATANKVRAFTKQGLAAFLGVSKGTLDNIRTKGDPVMVDALDRVENVIYMQKFENAGAGLLNANIITRDLGLADRSEVEAKTTVVIEREDADL